MAKFLGIDYGTKRIGVAVSDENAILAFPKAIVPNNLNAFKAIGDILKKENISEIVIGESLDLRGRPNILSAEIETFIKELKSKFNLPVRKEKEFLTSVEARRHLSFGEQARGREGKESKSAKKLKKPEDKKIDTSAAALILQRYLDKINLKK
jgi:putative Holliday junction resolvase